MTDDTALFSTHVQAFSKLLITLRAQFDNDINSALIMAVIADRHYSALAQSKGQTDTSPAPASSKGRLGINTLSIALYTEIPRETVRRKVAALVEKGWVKCDARGNLSPTPQAAIDLESATAATVEFLDVVTREARRGSP
ncbi:MAG: hypothetical protein ACOH1V_13430 [Stenotrophomonas sp.]